MMMSPHLADKAGPVPNRQVAHAHLTRIATLVSLSVALLLISIKGLAWHVTGSTAVLGSLLDSGMDLMASVTAYAGTKVAVEPADANHRFGHQKAEPMAGMVQAMLIVLSGLFILYESIASFRNPTPLPQGGLALTVMMVSLILTISLVAFQSYVLQRRESLAVEGDRAHYIGDILANIGAIIAIFLSIHLGWYRADAVAGLMAGLFLLYAAFDISRRTLPQLMDQELSGQDREKIRSIVLADHEAIGLHALRTRKAGDQIYIQLHLELNPEITLRQAHEIADRVEAALWAAYPGADVIVHQDPHGAEEDHDEFGGK